MKANILERFGGTENFVFGEVETPRPGANDVLVRLEAVGVNMGDAMIRSGSTGMQMPMPTVLGSEAAGVIEAVGSAVTGLKPGDRVYAAPFVAGALGGAYATHMATPAETVFKLPEHVSNETAVAVGIPGVTALRLSRMVPLAGRSVVVHSAAGGVGTLLVQLAKSAGARTVIGTVGDAGKASVAAEMGADEVVTYDRWVEAAKTAGVDVIFDAVGGEVSAEGLAVLAPGGTFITYGGSSGTYPSIGPEAFAAFVMRSQTIMGFSMWSLIGDPERRGTVLGGLFAELYGLLGTGKLKAVVGHRLPLEAAGEAHRLLESRKSTGKIILVP